MKPLARQLSIGLVVTLCVACTAAAAWFYGMRRPEPSLASRLPADAVLAYAELPRDDLSMYVVMGELAPSLPERPDLAIEVMTIAAVRMQDGTEGWITFWRDDSGATHIGGTDPTLKALFEDKRPALSSDPVFASLQFTDGRPWSYVAFPKVSRDGSSFARLLALDQPVSASITGSGMTLRVSAPASPAFALWSGAPTASVPNLRHTILLPAWRDMEKLSGLLTEDASIVIETLGRTLLDDIAPGMSPRYEMSPLFDSPSILQIGTDGDDAPFALEGRGKNAADVERVLRALHARFAANHGGTNVKTVSAEGFSLNTITVADIGATEERRDGEWVILETDTGDGSFASAWNGARFALTTAPDSLFVRSGDGAPVSITSIDWVAARASLSPLWPSLRAEDRVRVDLRGGPGYMEWSLEGVSGL